MAIDQAAYRALIGDVRRLKIPPPIVLRHLRHGFKDGRVCGECASYRAKQAPGPHCADCFTALALPAETPACGRFEERGTKAV